MNSIYQICPHRTAGGLWAFDDEARGLKGEPFVAGTNEIIDAAVADIPNAASGFALVFSDSPFPGCGHRLDWLSDESGGAWYKHAATGAVGWLCSALKRYYPEPPRSIFIQVAARH